MWRRWYQRHGFDQDVLSWSVVNAGAAAANAMGSRVSNRDLIPRFTRPGNNPALLIAFFKARKGAKVTTYGR